MTTTRLHIGFPHCYFETVQAIDAEIAVLRDLIENLEKRRGEIVSAVAIGTFEK